MEPGDLLLCLQVLAACSYPKPHQSSPVSIHCLGDPTEFYPPSTPRSSELFPSFRFPTKIQYPLRLYSYVLHRPPILFFLIDHPGKIWWGVGQHVMKLRPAPFPATCCPRVPVHTFYMSVLPIWDLFPTTFTIDFTYLQIQDFSVFRLFTFSHRQGPLVYKGFFFFGRDISQDILKEETPRKVVLFLHDNAPAHWALATQKKLAYLGFRVLITHPILPVWPRRTTTCSLDWKKNNSKVAIFRPTRRSLLPRRPGWTDKFLNFFEWLAKVRVAG